ncbi:MAG: DUF3105 domain-containing protein, partial [Acidimicrobiales bacterium]
ALVVGVLGTVGAVAAVVVADRRADDALIAGLTAGSCEYDSQRDSGSGHVATPTYTVNPPAGGVHLASAAPAGTYPAESLPPDGQLVHSLEHGYVVLWHRSGLPEADMERLRGVRDAFARDVLMVERPSLPTPVAAAAWHRRLLCPRAEPEPLSRFVDEFRNKGPERVPHP